MTTEEREQFVRLANKRVNSAIKAIQQVAKLSNASKYEFGQDDMDKIFISLEKELENCRKQFEINLNVGSWVGLSLDK